MFSFLLKVFIIAAIVVGLYSVYQYRKTGELPKPLQAYSSKMNLPFLGTVTKLAGDKLEPAKVGKNLSQVLDELVTHSKDNSPIVLGVKVTNESLGALVDVLQKLPTDQLEQLKVAICATESAGQQ